MVVALKMEPGHSYGQIQYLNHATVNSNNKITMPQATCIVCKSSSALALDQVAAVACAYQHLLVCYYSNTRHHRDNVRCHYGNLMLQ